MVGDTQDIQDRSAPGQLKNRSKKRDATCDGYTWVHSLRVFPDLSLRLDGQVAFAQLKLVCQLCPFLERSDLATVTHALVTSQLDYCNALYMGLPLESVWKQWIQNMAARSLTKAGYRDHIPPPPITVAPLAANLF